MKSCLISIVLMVLALGAFGQTSSQQYTDFYKIGSKGKENVSIVFEFPMFGWTTEKIKTDIANELFGNTGKTFNDAVDNYLSQYKELLTPTSGRFNSCTESHRYSIKWKGIVVGCYASCIVTSARQKLSGRMKGNVSETSKALLWNLKTGQLLSLNDVFTPQVMTEISALGGEKHQVFMDADGKLVLLFNKDGKQLEAAFSFISNEAVFNSQFLELVGKDAQRVEGIFSKGNGMYGFNEKTGELVDVSSFADKIRRPSANRPVAVQESFGVSSDRADSTSIVDGETKVFDVVEEMPSFAGGGEYTVAVTDKKGNTHYEKKTYPSGQAGLFQWLSNNIKYPLVAEENGIQGRVIVTFVVERDGSITEVGVVKSVDPSLDKEAVRVTKSMPNWIPGKQKGEPVRVKYTLPVTFRLK